MTHALFQHWFLPDTRMWFVNFMQQALYHPQYGYYTTKAHILGQKGDFITAPEMTPLFGQTLANACEGWLKQCLHPVILEFGAGSGRLCIDILSALEQKRALPERYLILEVSAQLKLLQQQAIQTALPHLFSMVSWLDAWPSAPINGVILANEVLDAMPVHRLMHSKEGILESQIYHSAQGELKEQWIACEHPRIQARMQTYSPPDVTPYVTEINGLLDDWLLQCANLLTQGALLLIDYGFPASEYFHPDRSMGTLMTHHNHHSHTDPLIHVGEQDITAHVDFTHVAEAAEVAGFDIAWFSNQAAFLLDNGLLNLMEKDLFDPKAHFNHTQVIQRLLSPSEMGELFKVMVLTKQCALPEEWSFRNDQRGRL